MMGLGLLVAGCAQTPADNRHAAKNEAAREAAAGEARRNCVTTGSRLGGSCQAGAKADARDILDVPGHTTSTPQ